MAEGEHKTLTLRIRAGVEPLAGRLEDEHGRGHEFVGWLGLASALERCLGARAATGAGDPRDEGRQAP